MKLVPRAAALGAAPGESKARAGAKAGAREAQPGSAGSAAWKLNFYDHCSRSRKYTNIMASASNTCTGQLSVRQWVGATLQ